MSEIRRGPEREPQISPHMEELLPRSEAREFKPELDAKLSAITDAISEVTADLTELAEHPQSVTDYEVYHGHLHDRFQILMDAWEELYNAKENLEKSIAAEPWSREVGEA